MNRREAFVAVAAGATGLVLPAEVKAIDPAPKGYVVINLFVGRLPPYKAEAFAARVKDQMTKKRHNLNLSEEKWPILVTPTRDSERSGVEVYVIDKNTNLRPIERLIYDTKHDRLLTVDRREKYAEEELQHIRDYVKLMLGAPVVELPVNIDDLIDYFIDRGQEYNVNNLQQFVFNMVQDDYEREQGDSDD